MQLGPYSQTAVANYFTEVCGDPSTQAKLSSWILSLRTGGSQYYTHRQSALRWISTHLDYLTSEEQGRVQYLQEFHDRQMGEMGHGTDNQNTVTSVPVISKPIMERPSEQMAAVVALKTEEAPVLKQQQEAEEDAEKAHDVGDGDLDEDEDLKSIEDPLPDIANIENNNDAIDFQTPTALPSSTFTSPTPEPILVAPTPDLATPVATPVLATPVVQTPLPTFLPGLEEFTSENITAEAISSMKTIISHEVPRRKIAGVAAIAMESGLNNWGRGGDALKSFLAPHNTGVEMSEQAMQFYNLLLR